MNDDYLGGGVDERVGQAGGRVECRQQRVRHLGRFVFEHGVAGQRVTRQQPTHKTNRGLEHGQLGVLKSDWILYCHSLKKYYKYIQLYILINNGNVLDLSRCCKTLDFKSQRCQYGVEKNSEI